MRPLRFVVVLLATATTLHSQQQAAAIATAVYRATSPSVFLIESHNRVDSVLAIGSAFLIDAHTLVTNAHVVAEGQPYLRIGAVALPLKISRSDIATDLALLTSATRLEATPLKLASSVPPVGTHIFVIGNPQGLERSLSEGLISGIRNEAGRELLQISAAISPGSSGGPVVDGDGVVVGVTVGYLSGGQNLNFAIPAHAVRSLIEQPPGKTDFSTAIAAVYRTIFQADASDLDWLEARSVKEAALKSAESKATSGDDYLALAMAADAASLSSLAEAYAETVLTRGPESARDSARVLLINKWRIDFIFSDSIPADRLQHMLTEANLAAAGHPERLDVQTFRALTLMRLHRGREAIAAARLGLESRARDSTSRWAWSVYHQVTARFSSAAEDDRVFERLVASGQASSSDWAAHAEHLSIREQWYASGNLYRRAFSSRFALPSYACNAGQAYWRADSLDDALELLRTCIQAYGTRTYVDSTDMAYAHRAIASILVTRGVYQAAEAHARQALAFNSADAWASLALSQALLEEGRAREAAAAAANAIRLSDGRYSSMHFAAGSAYFKLEDWERCAREFHSAAGLDTTSAAALYNEALCLGHQGYYADAARRLREVLLRDPKRSDRADIERMIRIWRR